MTDTKQYTPAGGSGQPMELSPAEWVALLQPLLAAASGPKYLALARALRDLIRSEKLRGGMRLLPVRELAYQLSITPGTVARAYQIATQEGLLEAVVGRGTFVSIQSRRLGPTEPLYEDRLPEFDRARDRITQDGPVDLRSPQLPDVGQPAALAQAMRDAADQMGLDYLHYPDMRRDAPLRRRVAEWLGGRMPVALSGDEIALTNGGQNGIHLVFSCCLRGDRPVVLVEELSYPGFRHAARLARAEVIGVPIDGEGMRADALDAICRKVNAQVVCLTTEAQNPTTARMSVARRREIAEVARTHDLQLIEDDCYETADSSFIPLRHYAPERVWQIVSLSKTVSAGLRFGAVVCPDGMGEAGRLAAQHSYFGVSRLVGDVAGRIFASGDVARISTLVHEHMGRRVQMMVAAFNGYDLRWQDGLSFVWLHLPVGWRASSFTRAAEAKGVLIRSADEYALYDGSAPNAVRLAVAGGVEERRFGEALKTLRRLLDTPPVDLPV